MDNSSKFLAVLEKLRLQFGLNSAYTEMLETELLRLELDPDTTHMTVDDEGYLCFDFHPDESTTLDARVSADLSTLTVGEEQHNFGSVREFVDHVNVLAHQQFGG